MPDSAAHRPRLEGAYVSTMDVSEAVAWLKSAAEPVRVITHAKPDGDAFGSVVAVVGSLRALGKEARGYVVPPVPAGIAHLPGQELVAQVMSASSLGASGSMVIVDTGAWSQVGVLGDAVAGDLAGTLIIDHHLSGDIPAGHRLIDAGAAACCELLWPVVQGLLAEVGGEGEDVVPAAVRDGLFAGLTSDTGWFRFSNARAATLRAAADLMELGVDHAGLYGVLEQSERPEKLALLRRAIDSLELLDGGRVAVMSLGREDFEAAGAREEETERFVDVPQQVESVEVVVLVCERLEGGGCKLSFRSKPGAGAVNVAEVAGTFGGGGHARAAGARMKGSLVEVLSAVRQRLMSREGV